MVFVKALIWTFSPLPATGVPGPRSPLLPSWHVAAYQTPTGPTPLTRAAHRHFLWILLHLTEKALSYRIVSGV